MLRTALITLATAAATVSAASAEEFGVSTTVGFESRYIFRGVQYAETSIQPAIELSYGNFYGGAWFNLPIGDDDGVSAALGGEELDLYAGYSTSLSEITTIDVGVTYYTFPEAMSGFGDIYEEDGDGLGANTVEVYAGLSFDLPLAPSIYMYHDFMFDTFTFEGGVSYSFPIDEKTSFDLGGSLGYVLDDDTGGDYLYGGASADVSYAVSDTGSFYVGVRYGGSDIDGGAFIDDDIAFTFKEGGFWWGLGFSASF